MAEWSVRVTDMQHAPFCLTGRWGQNRDLCGFCDRTPRALRREKRRLLKMARTLEWEADHD